MRNQNVEQLKDNKSPHLKDWLLRYGGDSLKKYKKLESDKFNKPLTFKSIILIELII